MSLRWEYILSLIHIVATLKLVEVETEKAIDQGLKNLAEQIKTNNAKINYRGLPIIVYNNETIVQVFENFIDNTIMCKSASDLVVNISAKEENGCWFFLSAITANHG